MTMRVHTRGLTGTAACMRRLPPGRSTPCATAGLDYCVRFPTETVAMLQTSTTSPSIFEFVSNINRKVSSLQRIQNCGVVVVAPISQQAICVPAAF